MGEKVWYLLMRRALRGLSIRFMVGRNGEKRQGRRYQRENLVAGRRKHRKDLIAPMLFNGSLDAVTFERWLEVHLLPALTRLSVL